MCHDQFTQRNFSYHNFNHTLSTQNPLGQLFCKTDVLLVLPLISYIHDSNENLSLSVRGTHSKVRLFKCFWQRQWMFCFWESMIRSLYLLCLPVLFTHAIGVEFFMQTFDIAEKLYRPSTDFGFTRHLDDNPNSMSCHPGNATDKFTTVLSEKVPSIKKPQCCKFHSNCRSCVRKLFRNLLIYMSISK